MSEWQAPLFILIFGMSKKNINVTDTLKAARHSCKGDISVNSLDPCSIFGWRWRSHIRFDLKGERLGMSLPTDRQRISGYWRHLGVNGNLYSRYLE